jgi:hypothetical protein
VSTAPKPVYRLGFAQVQRASCFAAGWTGRRLVGSRLARDLSPARCLAATIGSEFVARPQHRRIGEPRFSSSQGRAAQGAGVLLNDNRCILMRRLFQAVFALIPLAAPWGVRAQSSPDTTARPAESTVQSSGAPLHPGDRIRLRIWREPDLSGDYDVDESGQAVFPKVGPLKVTGMSPEELKQTLVKSYAVFLRNPSVEVRLLRRVNILGAVRTPGLYQVDPTMSLADAAALAGGASSDGNPNKVDLIRDGVKLPVTLSRKTRLADTPLQSGDQLYFHQRSWFSRNTGVVAGLLTATAGFIITLAN